MSIARPALNGQVAIVTGAGRGIGHAVAMAFAHEGATVVLVSRTRQELAATAAAIRESGGSALAIPAGVANDGAGAAVTRQAFAERGRLRTPLPAARAAPVGPGIGTKPTARDPVL